MKKFDIPSDEFLRESLRDYRMTPSDAARNAFLKEASGIIQSGRSSRRGWILPSLLLLLAGFAWVIWTLLAHEEVISTPVKQEVSRQNSVSTDSPPLSLTKSTPASASSSIKTTTEKPIEAVSVSPAEAVHSQPHSSSLTQSSSGNKTKEFPESSEFKPAPATTTMEKPIRDYGLTTATPAPSQSQPLTNQDPATSGRSEQNPAENASLVSPASPATSSKPASALTSAAEQSGQPATPPATVIATEKQEKKEAGNIRRSDHRNNNGRVAGGVFYTPEWLHNTLDGNNIAHNFGLEGVFRYGGFSIRTGAGISIASGANEIEVAYKPYLGDYRKLDSIQFTWSDPEHKYIPKMFMSTQDVFDTLTAYDYSSVEKRYTYLRIPVVFGYDFWKTEKISMGLRAGPVLSLLLSTKQLSEAYDPGQNRILRINDISPGQLDLNWQIMAGLGISVRLSRNLLLDLEPEASYYFNSAFERPANRQKPWSAGFRTALMIEL